MEISSSALYSALMRDMAISENDRKYVLTRLAAEGKHFLTVELPKVSKAMLVGLESGHFDRTELTSFRFKNSTLAFCGELLNKIFSKCNGILLTEPCSAAVGTIRQLCEYSYKLAYEFTEVQENKAKESFIKNEAELQGIGSNPEVLIFANKLRKDFETYYKDISRVHAHQILQEFRPRPTNGTFVGCDEFYFIDRISTASSRAYPSDVAAFRGYFKPYEGVKSYPMKGLKEPSFSELLLVPKDSRGPRTICRETLKRVETQMSYFDFMVSSLTRISQGAINFKDQLVNRKIAEESSVSKLYSTLDLKDASDRVSYKVISTIFRNSPGLNWFLNGSRRATHVKIDGEYQRLHKLAGMGSGLTFPSMSLLISLAICRGVKDRFAHLQYQDIRKDVFVYGDDICVPTKWADIAVIHLAKIGLKVNVAKSFVKGYFRESCGGDYFFGRDVTPCRVKLTNSKVEPNGNCAFSIADNAMAFKQLYEHTKELWKRGFKNAAKYLIGILDKFYLSRFGVRMSPGGFDIDCSLPVNYTIGTRHVDVFASTDVYTIQPTRRVGLDETKVVSRDGKVYQLDPLKYIGSSLKVGPRDKSVFCHTSGKMVNTTNHFVVQNNLVSLERTSPSADKRFGEVTNPRDLTFRKVSIPNDFFAMDFNRPREWFEERLRVEKFWNDLAALFVSIPNHAFL